MSAQKPVIPIVEAPATVIPPGGVPVVTAPPPAPAPPKVGDKNTAPTTTAADDERTAGQRKINFIWECTQATLAIVVTLSTLFVAGSLAIKGSGNDAAFLLLSNSFFVVVTTYLTRTNHTRVGGVKKEDEGR